MNTNFHTVSRMRENCTYGSMRGRTYPAGASRSTLHPEASPPTRVRVPCSSKDGTPVNLMDEPLVPQEDASGRWLELDDLTPIVFRNGETKDIGL